MSVGEVIGDDRDALVAEHLGRVFAERVVRLRGGPHRAREPGVRLALREVLGCGRAGDSRRVRLPDVVVDGERLESSQRADDDVHLVALDQLLGFCLRACGVAASVGEDKLHLASGERVVALLEKELDALLHLLAARGEGPGAHGEKADPDRLALRLGEKRNEQRAAQRQ